MLTQKETNYLEDFKKQEQLCVEKYTKHSQNACSPSLKNLFGAIAKEEQTHLDTVNQMLQGNNPSMVEHDNKINESALIDTYNYSMSDRQKDSFLCSDALGTEKHASSTYNTGIFEFKNTTMRDTLNHIQKEEQHHGELLYKYMEKNGMYN